MIDQPTPERRSGGENTGTLMNKKQLLWSLLFVVIAVASVLAVVMQSQAFSLAQFWQYITNASPLYLLLAFLCMICFILFEAVALLVVCRAFGYRPSFWSGCIYSASDIYFSAITPSATGGQPASAYFMMKDKMPGVMVTIILLVNLFMYTLSIVAIGAVCFAFDWQSFMQYDTLPQVLIAVGFLVQVGMVVFFLLLLMKHQLLKRMCTAVLRVLCKLRLLRNYEEKQKKLDAYMRRYRRYAIVISGHRKTLLFCFLFNFLQRSVQLLVPVFVYVATTGRSLAQALRLWSLQGYVVLGSNCVPVPGAMGISDYLMLEGFGRMMDESTAVHLELLSRSFSFYICILLCGISVLVQYVVVKQRGK